jgi:hypothetical protein
LAYSNWFFALSVRSFAPQCWCPDVIQLNISWIVVKQTIRYGTCDFLGENVNLAKFHSDMLKRYIILSLRISVQLMTSHGINMVTNQRRIKFACDIQFERQNVATSWNILWRSNIRQIVSKRLNLIKVKAQSRDIQRRNWPS